MSCLHGLLGWPTTMGLQSLIVRGKLPLLLVSLGQRPMGGRGLAEPTCAASCLGPSKAGLAGQVERLLSQAATCKTGSA